MLFPFFKNNIFKVTDIVSWIGQAETGERSAPQGKNKVKKVALKPILTLHNPDFQETTWTQALAQLPQEEGEKILNMSNEGGADNQ